MSCRACNGEQGAAHTCEASGVPVATIIRAEQELAGTLALPLYEVTIGLRLLALDRHDADKKLRPLVAAVLELEDVQQPVTFTTTEAAA